MSDTIKLRRGTAATWTANNPTLAAGEPGIETDTRLFKFGTGVTAWNDLPYASAGSSTLHAGSATLASGSATVSASWVTADTVIVVTPQTDDASARSLFVDPTNIVAATSFEISSSDGSDSRAAFWLATEPTETVESGFVLQTDGSAGDAFLHKNLGSNQADLWLTVDIAFAQGALDFWDANAGGGYFCDLQNVDPTEILAVWLDGSLTWTNDGVNGDTSATPVPVGDTWKHFEFHYDGSGLLTEMYIDTVLALDSTGTPDSGLDIRHVNLGQMFPAGDASELVYFKNIKIGTTQEGSEIMTEDFSGDLSAWDVTGDCTIVADPF